VARRRGPVTPIELAEAAVLADLALGLVVLGWLLPLGSALFAAACVPLVVLGVRQRPRVLFVGVGAAAALGFLVGGTGVVTNLAGCLAVSGMVAVGIRRRWGPLRAAGASLLFLWPPAALVTDGLLVVFGRLRRLSLDQLRNLWNALHHLLVRVHLPAVARAGDRAVRWGITHWWVLVPAFELFAIGLASLFVYGIALRVVGRLADGPPRVVLDGATDSEPPGPVPVAFDHVAFRYPGATVDALHDVTTEIAAHRYVAVTGANGAGKSTLVRLLAGAPPTAGAIHRPGAVALGRAGGTAIVFQRPESQVLGVRVRDDVVWGMQSGATRPDVGALLDSVGLGGLGDRDTDSLSGGQLQRLAIAAALARRPALLVSDESTAMLDPAGRDRLLGLLRALPDGDGPTVVHATHRAGEIAAADAVVALGGGPTAPTVPTALAPPPVLVDGRLPRHLGPPGALVDLRGVGYVYSEGTPWAHRALRDIDLTLGSSDAMLVVGGNGSGKTTLAWLLAGLLTPTEGEALLAGDPIVDQVGRVGLGFQHARLQLLHQSVAGELGTAIRNGGRAEIVDALALVGLPPAFASRAIDDLSGGQQRRVALARLLVTDTPLLVLDEPLAGLDDAARAELVAVLAALRASRPISLVIVSHDLTELAPVVDRVVALRDGEIVISEPATDVDAVRAFLATEDA
jgi:energy-coupling factor transport system ATP-binding protein